MATVPGIPGTPFPKWWTVTLSFCLDAVGDGPYNIKQRIIQPGGVVQALARRQGKDVLAGALHGRPTDVAAVATGFCACRCEAFGDLLVSLKMPSLAPQ
jgi:hypothetical protein